MEEIKSISKEIDFDYAHRVPLHMSKCKNLHGHRGTIIAELTGDLVSEGAQTDMILDYGFLKKLLVDNVDKVCDHGIILSIHDDKFVNMAYDENLTTKKYHIFSDWHREITDAVAKNDFWAGQTRYGKTYIIAGMPTAEYLAKHFYKILAPKVLKLTKRKAYLSAITFKETPSSTATFRVKE